MRARRISPTCISLATEKPIEDYECMSCGHRYKAPPGPTECHACGHECVRWLSYSERRWERP